MATRSVKPTPRGKPSGVPFLASLVDVAAAAGLHAPIIYGGVERKEYIVETMGCGCAFLDYLRPKRHTLRERSGGRDEPAIQEQP